jgi:hypothetical protein
MSVISVTELARERRGGYDSNGLTFTRAFQVITDDPQDGPLIVMSSIGVSPMDPYAAGNEADPGCFAKRFTPNCDDKARTVWTVTVDYDSQFDKGAYDKQQYPNPLDRPPEVQWTTTYYTMALEKDKDGVAVKNSAGDVFDPPLPQEISRPTVTISRNFADFDPQIKYDYENAISTDEFLGGEAKTWLCRRIDATLQYELVPDVGLISFWAVTFVAEHNRDKWNPVKVLDLGFNYLDSGDLVKAKDESGQPVSNPVRLNGSGALLGPADADVFRSINAYREISFASLGIL